MGAISNNYNELFVSDGIKESLERYVNNHIQTGSFLESVLANDLYGAVLHADVVNIEVIPHITQYVLDHVPEEARGSRKQVSKWLKRRK
jgi:hypothetical protein